MNKVVERRHKEWVAEERLRKIAEAVGDGPKFGHERSTSIMMFPADRQLVLDLLRAEGPVATEADWARVGQRLISWLRDDDPLAEL